MVSICKKGRTRIEIEHRITELVFHKQTGQLRAYVLNDALDTWCIETLGYRPAVDQLCNWWKTDGTVYTYIANFRSDNDAVLFRLRVGER